MIFSLQTLIHYSVSFKPRYSLFIIQLPPPISERRTSNEMDVLHSLGKWFSPNFKADRLYESDHNFKHKFGSVKTY